MNDNNTSLSPTPKRRRHRALRIVLGLVIFGVVLVLMLPTIGSMDWMRARIERDASAALGSTVTIGDYRLGWFSGVEVDDLTIANPEGFPQDQQLFALGSMRGDAGFIDLLRGRVSLEGNLTGLELRVIQKADGTTNVQALGRQAETTEPTTDEPTGSPDVETSGSFDLADVRLDLELRDSTIEVKHEVNGVLERMSNVQARVSKEFGTPVVRLDFAADLDRPGATGESGRVELRVDAEPDPERPVDAHLTAIGLDLSRYQPLLASFLEPGQVTAFAGIVNANTRVTGVPADRLTVDGSIEIDSPHFAGPLFKDMDVQAERFTLRPQLTATVPRDGEAPEIDLSNVTADLGFLNLQGLATESGAAGAPSRTGLEFDIDLARLASFGGPIPEMLKGSGARMTGELKAPLLADYRSAAPADLVKQLGLVAELRIERLAYVDQLLTGLVADLSLANGALRIDTKTATFDGGALTLTADVDATNLERPPVRFEVGVQGADVGASAIAALQYAVPMLAGLQKEVEAGRAVTFRSKVDTRASFQGTAFPAEGQDVLAWLDEWTGQGDLALRQGRLQPAPELGNLMAFAGARSKTLDFNEFATRFVLRQGFIESTQMKLEALGKDIGFQGRTSLAGMLDYTFDAKALLAAHRDGQRVLEYLGDAPLGAKLVGTLTTPSLDLPDLQQLTQKALEGALQKQGESLLDRLLKPR